MTVVAPRLGFIGLGDIGLPMARRVLTRVGAVVAWNRSPEKLAAFADEGAEAALSPADLARSCEVIGLCLTSHEAVEAVAFGKEGIIAGCNGTRKVIADFSTGSPAKAAEFAARAARAGVGWVDAPVSGGVPGAEAGTLVIFAGGDPADIAAARPLFDVFAARVTRMGGPGAGQSVKLCNQMMVACGVLVMAETLAAARRAGVDVAQLPVALAGGFADSIPLQIFGPRMAEHCFTPRLGAIALMAKDLRLARAMAQAGGADVPISDLCLRLYESVDRHATLSGQSDLSAVIGLFEEIGEKPS